MNNPLAAIFQDLKLLQTARFKQAQIKLEIDALDKIRETGKVRREEIQHLDIPLRVWTNKQLLMAWAAAEQTKRTDELVHLVNQLMQFAPA